MEKTIYINGIDMLKEKGWVLSSKTISMPDVQTKFISIPLRDGQIDITESLTGDIQYDDRKITFELFQICDSSDCMLQYQNLAAMLHGKRLQFTFEDDLNFYYEGRFSVGNYTKTQNVVSATITIQAEPFKYDLLTSADDWLWDSFDFEYGYINEAVIDVDTTATYTLICRAKQKIVTVYASANDMELVYNGSTYSLAEGDNKLYGLKFSEGENTVTLNGTGTVKIYYRGGML